MATMKRAPTAEEIERMADLVEAAYSIFEAVKRGGPLLEVSVNSWLMDADVLRPIGLRLEF